MDLDDDAADPLALAVALVARLLGARDDGLGAAEVDDDVAALEALDGAVDHLAGAVDVLVVDLLALGFAHPLVEDLLGGLRGDAPEPLGGDGGEDLVADLGAGLVLLRLFHRPLGRRVLDHLDDLLDGPGVELAGLRVPGGANGLLDPVLLLGCGGHRVFERLNPALVVDFLLARDLAQHVSKIDFRGCLCLSHTVLFLLLDHQLRELDVLQSEPHIRLAVDLDSTSTSPAASSNPASRPTTVARLPVAGSTKRTRARRPTKRAKSRGP